MHDDMRTRLTKIFADTEKYYTENETLAAAVAKSRDLSVFYPAEDYPELPEKKQENCEVAVTISRTYQAAIWEKGAHPERRVCVLNFASAVNPGGGVTRGSGAQEESLCRCSTLYPCLDQGKFWNAYYDVNRAASDPLYTDACIYTPDVIICKTDETFPRRMDEAAWEKVDVITCAAPNLRNEVYNFYTGETTRPRNLSSEKQYDIHLQRAKHIFQVAAARGADTLILGAFGCGAFRNDPEAVAKAWRDAMADYKQYFKRIEYAVFCFGREITNYEMFRNYIYDT